jgi:hypothetical protein
MAIETPGTIVQVGARPAAVAGGPSRRGVVAAALLALGVAFGIAGLFPHYHDGASLASQAAQVVPHAIYLAVWSASAALILLGGTRGRVGALLAVGTSIVTFGFFFADAGTAIAGGARVMGAGLVLAIIGWAACAAGSAMAFRPQWAGAVGARGGLGAGGGVGAAGALGAGGALGAAGAVGAPGRPRWRERRSVLLLAGATLAALGAAAAFAPSWDSYTLRTAAGTVQTATAGNAFANPGLVIAGNIAVMAALVLVAVAAAVWRPRRLGAALLAGAAVPMVAQAISAVVQVAQGTSPAQLGISPAQAAQAGLTISSGLTAAFWIYCAFVVALLVAGAWMAIPRRPAAVAPVPPVASIVS